LASEIRPVSKINQKNYRSKKLDYKTLVALKCTNILSKKHKIKLFVIGKIEAVFAIFFASYLILFFKKKRFFRLKKPKEFENILLLDKY